MHMGLCVNEYTTVTLEYTCINTQVRYLTISSHEFILLQLIERDLTCHHKVYIYEELVTTQLVNTGM